MLPIIAICLSVCAILLTGANFLWTIYKDTAYRARVRVSVSNQRVTGIGGNWCPVMDVTNFGPGAITLDFTIFDSRSFLKRTWDRFSYKTITYSKSPIGKKLGSGDTHREILSDDLFVLGSGMKLVGVCDLTRCGYFAPGRQVRALTKELKTDPKWKPLLNNKNV